MNRSTKSRLTEKQLSWFPGDTLFEKIARSVCRVGTLPGKELFEAWEVARRVRRIFRGGRVVDLACGHGLLAHIMLLLDDSSPEALAVDLDFNANTRQLSKVIMDRWPRLKDRIHFTRARIEEIELGPGDLAAGDRGLRPRPGVPRGDDEGARRARGRPGPADPDEAVPRTRVRRA